MRSLPADITGIAFLWTGVSVLYPDLSTFSKIRGLRFASVNCFIAGGMFSPVVYKKNTRRISITITLKHYIRYDDQTYTYFDFDRVVFVEVYACGITTAV